MLLIIILITVFVATFVFVLVWFRAADDRKNLRRAVIDQPREWSDDVALLKWFFPAVVLVKPVVTLLPAKGYRDHLDRWVIHAGLDRVTDGSEIMILQTVLALFFPILFMGVTDSVAGLMVCCFGGLIYPFLWLWEKKKKRQQAILVSFPNIVDMLALTVEAGADFNSGITKICEQFKGSKEPLIDELVIMQQNIRLGMIRAKALKQLAERVDLQEVYSFISILIQADNMGASISRILKEQSNKLRKERFIRAEKLGAEASQKLMVPMVIFIFPLLFFIVLGPYILGFIYGV